MPIWFVSKEIKPEKCITGDTLAPEKKALMITGDARGSQRVNYKKSVVLDDVNARIGFPKIEKMSKRCLMEVFQTVDYFI